MTAQQFLGLHRQHVAVEHRRGLDESLRQRERRQFDRKSAGLQYAALDVLGARPQMHVAGIDLAPGIDDADDRLAAPILGVIADLTQPRAVAERTQVIDAEPAVAAQVLRTLTSFHERGVRSNRASLNRKVGGVDDLFPLGRFAGEKLAEIGRRTGDRDAAEVLELGQDAGILERER